MWSASPPSVLATLTAQFVFDLEWVLVTLALLGLLVGGFVVVLRIKRAYAKDESASAGEQLSRYRALVEEGLMKPEEFEKIRGHLERKPPPP